MKANSNEKKKTGIDFLSIFFIIVILSAGLLMVNCSIEQYEKTYRAKQLTAELEQERNNGEILRIEYEKRTNYREVEDYVVNNLGMAQLSKYQYEYIVSTNTNTTQLIMTEEDNAGFFTRIASTFSIISEYFN